jgi:UDP-glucose:tetrahydrobiopterin glucosyltransferase
MNILLVSGPGITLKEPYRSGIEAFMVSLANQLIAEGHQVDIIAQEAGSHVKFGLINPFGATSLPGFLKNLKEEAEFQKLDADAYDMIHFNMFYPHLLSAGLQLKKPVFLTLHSPADNKRIKAYQKLARKGEITFVAISRRMKQHWDKALGLNMPMINNGINLNLWSSNRSRTGKYLLWSARINKEKNLVVAISLAKYMKLPLMIAGRIVDQHYFETLIKPHLNDQIQYVGHITQRELSNLAANASAYLATATWQEPFGLAALEMLASGVPVVGFDTAVPTDWKHESVLTTDSTNWQDLIALVEQSYAITSATCQEFASSMSIESMTSGYVTLYQQVLLRNNFVDKASFPSNQVPQINIHQPPPLNSPGL